MEVQGNLCLDKRSSELWRSTLTGGLPSSWKRWSDWCPCHLPGLLPRNVWATPFAGGTYEPRKEKHLSVVQWGYLRTQARGSVSETALQKNSDQPPKK